MNHPTNDIMEHKIAFYTVFYGSDYNWANLLPSPPTDQYPCYYLTNNPQTYNKLTWSKWIPVLLTDIPIYNDDIKDAMSAKLLKTCPHRSEILDQYEYLCYFDSKTQVDGPKALKIINQLAQSPQSIVLSKHPLDFHDVWDEYQLCLQYPKYACEQEQYKRYLDLCLNAGFRRQLDTHYTTQMIIRKNNPIGREIGEVWYDHVQNCGIECQISFSIIQQIYKHEIMTIDYQACYSYF